MPRDNQFSEVLTRLRKAQGFPNAHSFYKARGGRKAIGLSFANYLNLEKGKSLPSGRNLPGLIASLGLGGDACAARDLLLAYLRDLTGSDALLEALKAPSADPVPASWLLAESAARQAISQRSVQLTLEQYKVLAESRLAYACHVILANTSGWIEKRELAGLVGAAAPELERALKSLKLARLAQLEAGRARSPLAGRYVVPPVVSPATSAIYARLAAHREDWLRSSGKARYHRYLLLRAPQGRFSAYLPHLGDVVSLSAVYGDVERGGDSEIYLVEGRVTQLFAGPQGSPESRRSPHSAKSKAAVTQSHRGEAQG